MDHRGCAGHRGLADLHPVVMAERWRQVQQTLEDHRLNIVTHSCKCGVVFPEEPPCEGWAEHATDLIQKVIEQYPYSQGEDADG